MRETTHFRIKGQWTLPRLAANALPRCLGLLLSMTALPCPPALAEDGDSSRVQFKTIEIASASKLAVGKQNARRVGERIPSGTRLVELVREESIWARIELTPRLRELAFAAVDEESLQAWKKEGLYFRDSDWLGGFDSRPTYLLANWFQPDAELSDRSVTLCMREDISPSLIESLRQDIQDGRVAIAARVTLSGNEVVAEETTPRIRSGAMEIPLSGPVPPDWVGERITVGWSGEGIEATSAYYALESRKPQPIAALAAQPSPERADWVQVAPDPLEPGARARPWMALAGLVAVVAGVVIWRLLRRSRALRGQLREVDRILGLESAILRHQHSAEADGSSDPMGARAAYRERDWQSRRRENLRLRRDLRKRILKDWGKLSHTVQLVFAEVRDDETKRVAAARKAGDLAFQFEHWRTYQRERVDGLLALCRKALKALSDVANGRAVEQPASELEEELEKRLVVTAQERQSLLWFLGPRHRDEGPAAVREELQGRMQSIRQALAKLRDTAQLQPAKGTLPEILEQIASEIDGMASAPAGKETSGLAAIQSGLHTLHRAVEGIDQQLHRLSRDARAAVVESEEPAITRPDQTPVGTTPDRERPAPPTTPQARRLAGTTTGPPPDAHLDVGRDRLLANARSLVDSTDHSEHQFGMEAIDAIRRADEQSLLQDSRRTAQEYASALGGIWRPSRRRLYSQLLRETHWKLIDPGTRAENYDRMRFGELEARDRERAREFARDQEEGLDEVRLEPAFQWGTGPTSQTFRGRICAFSED